MLHQFVTSLNFTEMDGTKNIKPVWHISLLCVQWKTPDDGQRNCPKHVESHLKNKFEKLMYLVGFYYLKENAMSDLRGKRSKFELVI
jgi:hypothetical protein